MFCLRKSTSVRTQGGGDLLASHTISVFPNHFTADGHDSINDHGGATQFFNAGCDLCPASPPKDASSLACWISSQKNLSNYTKDLPYGVSFKKVVPTDVSLTGWWGGALCHCTAVRGMWKMVQCRLHAIYFL